MEILRMTRRVLLTMIVATVWLTPAVFAQNRAGDIGAGPIEGTWAVTGSEREGTPWREIAGAAMTIGGGQFALQFTNGGPAYKGDVKPAGRPQLFDFVHKEGPDAGKTWLALVSSNGELLKICFAYAGDNDRPTTLTTSPGEGTTLIGLRRR
jgi:uncharacterized protein (TIGR03067 family)